MQKNIYILNGLPASGKTYYAEELKRELIDKTKDCFNNNKCYIVDCDNDKLHFPCNVNNIIIDGLFLTNDDLIKLIKDCVENLGHKELIFTIVHFKKNRKICLLNDKGRVNIHTRSINSENTIKHAKFECPDKNLILKATGIKNLNIVKKDIFQKDVVFEKEENNKYNICGNYIISQEWLTGGSYSCYGGGGGSYEPEEPVEFDKLYNFLETICPNLTFLHFRKIERMIKTIEREESDYYSTTYHQHYEIKIDELLSYLREKGYIKE